MPSPVQKPSLSSSNRTLAVHWRVLISIALMLHLTAVISAPMALPPSSDLQRGVATAFRPYLDATYLDHGYRFFAPSPGPSHLVQYRLEMPDGTTSTGVFPNLKNEWPRLFYHRHFMLSEKLNGHLPPLDLPPDAPADMRDRWQAEWNSYNTVAQSYAQHLLHESGAKRVTLELVRHNLPFPQQVERGQKLDDAKMYEVLWKHSYEGDAS